MKKEVLIAIIFGLIVGLIITVGMYRARRAMESVPNDDLPITVDTTFEETPAPQVTSEKLRLREPEEESLSLQKDIRVSGTTIPNSTIAILLNEREMVGVSDAEGNFSIPVVLESGANVLVVRVLADSEDPIEVTRTVVFDTEVEATASPSAKQPTPKATATTKKVTPSPKPVTNP